MSDSVIERSANPQLKWLRRLQQGKHRRTEGVALAEGIKLVTELARDPERVVRLFWSDTCLARPGGRALLQTFYEAGVPLTEVLPKLLAAAADTQTSQGVIAVVACVPTPLQELLERPGDVLVLDGVQDPGNVGTLIRTAAAAGAAGVVLTAGCADPGAAKVMRAAAGTAFWLPYAVWDGSHEGLCEALSGAGLKLCVSALGGADRLSDISGRVAWVLGAEGAGVGEVFRAHARYTVEIPMAAGVESLNVAVAGALMLFAKPLRGTPLGLGPS